MRSKKKLIQSKRCLKTLAYKLDQLCKFLDEVYGINNGGCCFIAYCIANLLEQDDISYNVGIVHDYPIKSIEDISFSVCHVFISINDMNINCEDEEYQIFSESSQSIIQYYNRVSWNTIYDYTKNVYLKKLITNFYYDFTEDFREG